MSFIYPIYLTALAALAVPLIIHLINLRRPKSVPFSTLSFFEEIQQSTIRRIRIKEYLLLALRILALAMLALSLARPFLPNTQSAAAGSDKPQTIALLIDNSPSMQQIDEQGPYLKQGKEVARKIIEESRSDDRFVIQQTNGESLQDRVVGRSRALELVEAIESQNKGNYTGERLRHLREQLGNKIGRSNIVHWISDAQETQIKSLSNVNSAEKGGQQSIEVPLNFIKVGSTGGRNIAISDVTTMNQILSAGKPVSFEVEVTNYSTSAVANQYLSLQLNGEMSGQYQLELEPGQSKQYVFEVIPEKSGDIRGKFLLEGDDMPFDNTRYFVLHIPESREVLLVQPEDENEGGEFSSYLTTALNAARQTSAGINLTTTNPADMPLNQLGGFDAVIFDGVAEIPEYSHDELQNWIQNGHGMLFLPSEKGNIENYNRFLTLLNASQFSGVLGEYASFNSITRLSDLDSGHPVLEDLFEADESDQPIRVSKPDIYYYYNYRMPAKSGGYAILETETGNPLLAEQSFGDGRVIVSTIGADPGWSNFPVKALFAPLYYRVALYTASTEKGGIVEHTLGEPLVYEGNFSDESIVINSGEVQVKPDVEVVTEGVEIKYAGYEWTPGVVEVTDGSHSRQIALNQDIMESDFTALSKVEVEKYLDKYLNVNTVVFTNSHSRDQWSQRLTGAAMGKELWNWFMWLGLLLLILETVISKWFKAETIT